MLVIRLKKKGRKKLNIYDIVVTNKRSARDGKYIEKLGYYNSNATPSIVKVNEELCLKWLNQGAEISTTVKNILSNSGILLKNHLSKCVKKGTLNEEKKNNIISEWKKTNEKKTNKKFIFVN